MLIFGLNRKSDLQGMLHGYSNIQVNMILSNSSYLDSVFTRCKKDFWSLKDRYWFFYIRWADHKAGRPRLSIQR